MFYPTFTCYARALLLDLTLPFEFQYDKLVISEPDTEPFRFDSRRQE